MYCIRYSLFAVAFIQVCTASTLRRLGTFAVKNPAFATLYVDNQTSGSHYNLIVSAFSGPSLFGSADSVYLVRDVSTAVGNTNAIVPELVTKSVTWPNEISNVPDGIFSQKMLAIPDGFLVPFKTNGAIKLVDVTTPGSSQGPYVLTSNSGGDWFYHRVEWRDMDGDGDQDIVTCRAREPLIPGIFGQEDEELLWLENPSGDFRKTWTPHVLTHGPGVYFKFTSMPTTEGQKECIFTAQFFRESLSVYWTTNPNGLFIDSKEIQSRVIDNSIGRVFDVEVGDINHDGRPDLIVTTNGNNGSLIIYQIPDDFRTGNFVKHVLASGFKPRHPGTGKGSTGSALAIHPQTANTNTKPVILLSGDDDGRAYMFEALSQDPFDWTYNKTTFLDVGDGTVGEIAAADVNNDGYVDVFVPSYNGNQVVVFSFKQATDDLPLVG